MKKVKICNRRNTKFEIINFIKIKNLISVELICKILEMIALIEVTM